MLLAMYALVIFTLTFLAVISNLFGKQAPRFAEETRAGYDVLVESNPANPVSARDARRPARGQPRAAPLLRGFPEWSFARPSRARAVGHHRVRRRACSPTASPSSADRAAPYAHRQAAWEAVLAPTRTCVIVSDFFLQEGGPPESVLDPGDKFTIHNRTTGEERELTVAGMVTRDWVFNGVFIGAPFARDVPRARRRAQPVLRGRRPGPTPTWRPGALQGRLLEHGVEADSFRDADPERAPSSSRASSGSWRATSASAC